MKNLAILSALALLVTSPAIAQGILFGSDPDTTGTVIVPQNNTTGNDRSVIISRGATGADTIITDSAAGGNAGQPERAIPQGSANGGGSNR